MSTYSWSWRYRPPTANEMRYRHWAVKSKKNKMERESACSLTRSAIGRKKVQFPVTVTLTRKAKRMVDGDNWVIMCKSMRDGICDALGVDDGQNEIVKFEYDQVKSSTYSVACDIVEL